MSEKNRYRRGPQKIATGLIKAGVKAQVGDLMFRSTDEYLYPFGVVAVDGSGSGSGGGFTGGAAVADVKGACMGVLIEGATSGTETTDSRCVIGYGATYELDLSVAADANYPAGWPCIPVAVAGFIANQTLALNSARTNAVALSAREILQGDLTVYCEVRSSLMEQPIS